MRFSVEKVTINKTTKTGLSLQVNNTYGLLIHNPLKNNITFSSLQKTSWGTSLQQASLTIEAAIAVPFFLIAVIQLISFLFMYQQNTEHMIKLMQSSKKMSGYAILTEDLMTQAESENLKYIDLFECYTLKPLISLTGDSITCISRARVKTWTGYDNSEGEEQEKYVYVTDNQEVYHTDINCSYLKLSIQKVDNETIHYLINDNQEHYEPCAYCYNNDSNLALYITLESNHYHSDISCPGLTRNIHMVSHSEYDHLPICTRCGGE